MKRNDGWMVITVGDLEDDSAAEIKTGPFGTQLKAADYVEAGTPVINVRNVGFGGLRPAGLEHVPPPITQRLASHLLEPGDIVFGRKGAVERHLFVQLPQKGWMQGSDCIRLRLNSDRVDPRYASYSFLTQEHKTWMMNQGSHGATMASLNQDIIRRIPLYLPPIDTQRRIVGILSAYDDLIENNLRRIQILEEMAQALFREWFVEFRFPGHEEVEMADTRLGPVPVGWSIANLTDLVTTQYGYTASASEEKVGPRFLRGMDINKRSYIDWASVPFCPISDSDLTKYRLSCGDILIIRMADPGKVGLVEQDLQAVFASYLVRLKVVSPKVTPRFLFYFLMSDRYQGYITGASTGTTRKSASSGVLTGIDLVVPRSELVAEFDRVVTEERDLINVLVRKNSVLRATRDLLLPRLISGELDVSESDIDVGEVA